MTRTWDQLDYSLAALAKWYGLFSHNLILHACSRALVFIRLWWRIFGHAKEGCYSLFAALVHFLAWQAMVGLIAVALAKVAKILLWMTWIMTILLVSWVYAGCCQTYDGWVKPCTRLAWWIGLLLVVGPRVLAFAKSIVVYMLWGLASPWGIIFLFEFSCHFVIFAFSCDMFGIFATHKIVMHSLTSTSYAPFTATMKASASSTTMLSLVKVAMLVEMRVVRLHLFWGPLTRFFLLIVYWANRSHISLGWSWHLSCLPCWTTRGFLTSVICVWSSVLVHDSKQFAHSIWQRPGEE